MASRMLVIKTQWPDNEVTTTRYFMTMDEGIALMDPFQ